MTVVHHPRFKDEEVEGPMQFRLLDAKNRMVSIGMNDFETASLLREYLREHPLISHLLVGIIKAEQEINETPEENPDSQGETITHTDHLQPPKKEIQKN